MTPPLRKRSIARAGFAGPPGLLLVSLLIGCDQKPSRSEPTDSVHVLGMPKKHAPGEAARTPHFTLEVRSTKRCSVEPHFQPPAGIEKLGVELTVGGLSHVQVPVNPFYATLRAAGGARFEATLLGCTPQLEARRVTAGQSVTGWVTFDVPEGAEALELVYNPALIGAPSEPVTFTLGR